MSADPLTSDPNRASAPQATDPPTTTAGPGGNYRWIICTLLFFSVAVNYIDRLTIGILKRPLSEQLGWTDIDFGHIAAAFSFAYAFGYLFGGRLMDRWGVKKGLPVFVLVWSCAAAAHGLVGLIGVDALFHFPWFSFKEGISIVMLTMPWTAAGFVFARIALGLSEGGNFPGAIKAVAEWYPVKERALATGLFNAGTSVGSIFCPIVVVWVYGHVGWEATFYLTGATGFVWVVAWWLIYDAPEKHKRLSPAELNYIREGQPLVEDRPVRVPWLSLFGYRAVWGYVLASILTGPAWGFYQFFMPDFVDKNFAKPPLTAQDFPRLQAFASELNQARNGAALYVREHLPEQTRAALAATPLNDTPELRATLATNLNQLIEGPSLYDETRFAGVPLREETKSLIGKNLEGRKLARFNRLLLEDTFPNGMRRLMSLTVLGFWSALFFAITVIGGVAGGWVPLKLMNRGWTHNAARKTALLACALAVVPVFFAPFASTVLLAVAIVGIAGAAHQGWSSNLFTLVSDTMPKETISSVVGLGGFVAYFTGGFVNDLAGLIAAKTGNYVYAFAYFSCMYVLGLLVIQLFVPRIGKVQTK